MRARTVSRGYGADHRAMRELLVARYVPGVTLCSLCGMPMSGPSSKLHLDHAEDRLGWTGLCHARCNARRARGLPPLPPSTEVGTPGVDYPIQLVHEQTPSTDAHGKIHLVDCTRPGRRCRKRGYQHAPGCRRSWNLVPGGTWCARSPQASPHSGGALASAGGLPQVRAEATAGRHIMPKAFRLMIFLRRWT